MSHATRRVVTVLFADMVGSTGLGERLDAEIVRDVQARYFASLRETIERHGGTVEKYIGDAVMAVFGVPVLHEDDALRGIRAAASLTPSLAALNADLERRHGVRIEVRVGVNTGEVVADDTVAGTMVTGDSVNVAARLEQAAGPGEVVLGAETYELVRHAVVTEPLGELVVHGKEAPLAAYRWTGWVRPESQAGRPEPPLVGRDAQLEAWTRAYERAIAARECQLVTLVGAAGAGKSRLVREFIGALPSGSSVLRGRSLAYGDVTHGSVAAILRGAAAIDETDGPAAAMARLATFAIGEPDGDRLAAIMAALIGVSDEPVTEEDVAWALGWALRRVAEAVALLVVVLEDIHWAPTGLLDAVEVVASSLRDVPVVMVVTARPDLFDRRPDWGGGGTSTSIHVDGLDPPATRRLIESIPGGAALPDELRSRIEAAAEGNPLFLEEMLAKLVDDGHLRRVDGDWRLTADVGAVRVPSSVTALLAARIDSLEAGERDVAERASVVGRSFVRGAVVALSPEIERSRLGGRLSSLIRKELIRRQDDGTQADDEYQFRHVLIRDAAYDRLPKAIRAVLHEGYADWLEEASPDPLNERVEVVADHLAAAAEYRLQLGRLDGPGGRALAVRAVERLAAAAKRATQLNAHPEAARTYLRALAISDKSLDDATSAHLAAWGADATFLAGDTDQAVELARRVIALIEPRALPLVAGLAHERLGRFLGEVGDASAALDELNRAVELVPAAPTRERTRVLASLARWMMLDDRFESGATVAEEAVLLGRQAAAPSELASALTTLAMCLGRGRAFERQMALLDEAQALAVDVGDGFQILRAVTNRVILLEDRNRRGEADAAAAASIELLDQLRLLDGPGAMLSLNRAARLLDGGDVGGSEQLVQRVLMRPRRGVIGVYAHRLAGLIELVRGRADDAKRAFERATAAAPLGLQGDAVPYLHAAIAWLAAYEGRWRDGLQLLEGFEVRVKDANVDSRALLLLRRMQLQAVRADQARANGDRVELIEAERAANELLAAMEALDRPSDPGVQWRTPYAEVDFALLRAEFTRVRGRPDPEAWLEAANLAATAGFALAEVQAQARLVEALHRSGRPRDEVEAALVRARDLMASTGAVVFSAILDPVESTLGEKDPGPAAG